MQTLFDLDDLIRQADFESAPDWNGAPLGITTEHHASEDLDAAFDRWVLEHGHHGSVYRSRMWHRSRFSSMPDNLELNGHRLSMFKLEVSCFQHYNGCSCVTVSASRFVCDNCSISEDASTEQAVVELMHDHATPWWRELPPVPHHARQRDAQGRPSPVMIDWLTSNYPEHARTPGSPIITFRNGVGTRHVPGASPYGGYDISHTI